MDSRYCTYVIRSARSTWLGKHGRWVKRLKNAQRFFSRPEADTRAQYFYNANTLHIEEAEKL